MTRGHINTFTILQQDTVNGTPRTFILAGSRPHCVHQSKDATYVRAAVRDEKGGFTVSKNDGLSKVLKIPGLQNLDIVAFILDQKHEEFWKGFEEGRAEIKEEARRLFGLGDEK